MISEDDFYDVSYENVESQTMIATTLSNARVHVSSANNDLNLVVQDLKKLANIDATQRDTYKGMITGIEDIRKTLTGLHRRFGV